MPWSFNFTVEARNKLIAHYGHDDIFAETESHILGVGKDGGFFTDIGGGCVQDMFGVVWDRSIDKDIGTVKGFVLPEPYLKGYDMPDPLDQRLYDNIIPLTERYSDCFRLHMIGFSLFERAWTLRGMENLLMDFYDHPAFVRNLFNSIADYNVAQIREAVKYDIDAVYFGDDWGQQRGLIMGYPLWKKYIYPVLERMYGEVHKAGKYVFIHSCGDVDELFDYLIDAGLNCFNPFQPEVMDVGSLINKYRGRLAFFGGVSTQRTLPYGSVSDVQNEVSGRIDMGRDGGYIISPAHAVEGDVPLENMLAMIEKVKEQLK